MGYDWKQAAESLEHRQIALQMRAEGASLKKIGAALGVSHQAVSQMLQRAIRRVEGEAVNEYRMLWNARLESDYQKLDKAANQGDVQAIAVRIRITERAAKLLGLDAPTQIEHSGHIDVTELGDDELRAIVETSRGR